MRTASNWSAGSICANISRLIVALISPSTPSHLTAEPQLARPCGWGSGHHSLRARGVQRSGVSLLSNARLPEFIAQTAAQYVQLATDLAAMCRLSALRQGMRERLSASPLMDIRRFVADLEEVYRTLWRAWCGRG